MLIVLFSRRAVCSSSSSIYCSDKTSAISQHISDEKPALSRLEQVSSRWKAFRSRAKTTEAETTSSTTEINAARQYALPKPLQSESSQRWYGADTVARLSFIRRAHDLKVPQNQARKMINLSQSHGTLCTDVDWIAAERLAEVEARIAELQSPAGDLT